MRRAAPGKRRLKLVKKQMALKGPFLKERGQTNMFKPQEIVRTSQLSKAKLAALLQPENLKKLTPKRVEQLSPSEQTHLVKYLKAMDVKAAKIESAKVANLAIREATVADALMQQQKQLNAELQKKKNLLLKKETKGKATHKGKTSKELADRNVKVSKSKEKLQEAKVIVNKLDKASELFHIQSELLKDPQITIQEKLKLVKDMNLVVNEQESLLLKLGKLLVNKWFWAGLGAFLLAGYGLYQAPQLIKGIENIIREMGISAEKTGEAAAKAATASASLVETLGCGLAIVTGLVSIGASAGWAAYAGTGLATAYCAARRWL